MKNYDFEQIINNLPVPCALNDSDGRIRFVNLSFIRCFGYTSEDIPTLDVWWSLAYPDPAYRRWVVDTWQSNLDKSLTNGTAFEPLDVDIRTKDNQIKHVVATASDLPGAVNGLHLVALHDITERKQAESELQAAHLLMGNILDAIPDLLFEVDIEGRYLSYKSPRIDLLAAPPEVILGKTVSEILPPAAAAICHEALNEANLHRYSNGRAFWLMLDGSKKWFELSVSRMDTLANGLPRFIVLSRDITTRKNDESLLKLSASVFSQAREGISITDANGNYIAVNEAFCHVTGYSQDELIGNNPRMHQSGRQGAEFYKMMWEILVREGHWSGEVWNRSKNGEFYASLLSITAVKDDAGNIENYVALSSDITVFKEQQSKLERIAHYDVLTNLPNRTLLREQLRQIMSQAQRHKSSLAVAYIDLDGFKAVNDSYGHATGDEVLIAISQRMKSTLREGDILSRVGGDEFVAALVDFEDPKDSEVVILRMLHAASMPVTIGSRVFQLSASIGVTVYPKDGVTSDLLLRHADQAMYKAKQAGKNRYQMFDPQQDLQMRAHHQQMIRLRQALAAGEFELYYQPKLNVLTGEIFGVEGLIRWQHPDDGLLAPGQFLPSIENTDLEPVLGDWVIETALKQSRAWNEQGLSISISVNISANHLLFGDFVGRLRALLQAYPDVDASRLELEILETAALTDVDRAEQLLSECRKLGVCLSLDDFGTGYSSLSYFRTLPVDHLKIDQSFIRNMLTDVDDQNIVKGVIALAGAFGRPVIAEGVETLAHGQLLLSFGCHLCQGYGISRPMPAKQFPAWINEWNASNKWADLRSADATA